MTCANPRAVIPNMLLACILIISCSTETEPQDDGPLTAKAGLDQFVADVDIDGFGTVTLDGSASQGTIVRYDWSEGGSIIATSVNPTVELAIGIHSITLTVADNGGEEASDEVTVTVNSTSGPRQVVATLNFDRFKDNIRTLSNFGDRSQFGSGSQSFQDAKAWVVQQLEAIGYTVERHSFTFEGSSRENVYTTKVGTTSPDKMYIISAHLDGRGGGGAADDDGSGSALVLEAARAFAEPGVETDISIRFVWWNNEETGLNGSRAYAIDQQALQGVENPAGSGNYPEPTWLGIIQHDMILYDHGLPSQSEQIPGADIDIEYEAASGRSPQSRTLANALLAANGTYSIDYPGEVSNNMCCTDSVPFSEIIPAVSVRENQRLAEIGQGSNPNYHQPTDLFESYSDADFRLGFNALQMTVGMVAELTQATTPATRVALVLSLPSRLTPETVF